LSVNFPELVDEDGKGWLFCHAKSLNHFIRKNPYFVNKQTGDSLPKIFKGITPQWKNV